MANTFFNFKQFNINQESCAMKVSTDSCLFGAWTAAHLKDESNILDIGAGTGLLSLMLAQKNNGSFDSVEIEPTCFKQLKENILTSPWASRIDPINQDILFFEPQKKYDLIISNPPFYEGQLKSDKKNTNLARHENGLQLKDLLEKVKLLMVEAGSFFLLIPNFRKDECIELAAELALYPKLIADVRQSKNHNYIRTMFCFINNFSEIIQEEIDIKGYDGKYSERFNSLLKDYYLKIE